MLKQFQFRNLCFDFQLEPCHGIPPCRPGGSVKLSPGTTGDEASQSEWQDWQDWNNKKWKSWDSQASSSWQEAKSQAATPVAAPPLHLPAQFDSDGTFLDKTVVGQHQLYRQIQSTNCSRKRGLAGRSVEDLRVVEVARKGV